MIPVARYSPAFKLPFGYYLLSAEGPELKQVGIFSDSESYFEHQTLYPLMSKGQVSFDPGESSFGLYTVSPSHIAYSEDIWNTLFYAKNAAHAVRTYAVNDSRGRPLKTPI